MSRCSCEQAHQAECAASSRPCEAAGRRQTGSGRALFCVAQRNLIWATKLKLQLGCCWLACLAST